VGQVDNLRRIGNPPAGITREAGRRITTAPHNHAALVSASRSLIVLPISMN